MSAHFPGHSPGSYDSPQQETSTVSLEKLAQPAMPVVLCSAALVNYSQSCSSLGKWVAQVLRVLKEMSRNILMLH